MEFPPEIWEYILTYSKYYQLFTLSHINKYMRELVISYKLRVIPEEDVWISRCEANVNVYFYMTACKRFYDNYRRVIDMSTAFINDNLELASYLHKRYNLNIYLDVITYVLQNGRIEIIEYIHNNNVGFPYDACVQACRGGLKCLMYIQSLGYKYTSDQLYRNCNDVISENNVEIFKYLITHNSLSDDYKKFARTCIEHDNVECLDVLFENGYRLSNNDELMIYKGEKNNILSYLSDRYHKADMIRLNEKFPRLEEETDSEYINRYIQDLKSRFT